MRVDLAVLADYAAMTADQKLLIVGVFDTIWLGSFPGTYPSIFLALRIIVGPEDRGEHQLELRLTDPKGDQLVALHAGFSVRPSEVEEETGALQLVLQFGNVEFKEPGLHAVDVLIDDRFEDAVPLRLRERPS